MADLEWLDSYTGQTVDQLLTLEEEYRIDSLLLAFEQAIGQKVIRKGEEELTDEERTVLAVEGLEREVNDGGYKQFFVNASVEYAPIIMESLRRIGCPRTAEITQEALDAFHLAHLTVACIEDIMQEESEERDQALNMCSDLYFEAAENIEERLFAFIKANKDKIQF